MPYIFYFILCLELKIDKRLYGTALYLDNDVNNHDYEHGIYHNVGVSQGVNAPLLPTIGKEVTHVSEKHKEQYIPITTDDLS